VRERERGREEGEWQAGREEVGKEEELTRETTRESE